MDKFIYVMTFVAFALLIAISISLYRNRKSVMLYRIMTRDNGRPSKIAVTFLFLLPVILYQALFQNRITEGLIELLIFTLGAELGVQFINKGMIPFLDKRASKRPPNDVDDDDRRQQ